MLGGATHQLDPGFMQASQMPMQGAPPFNGLNSLAAQFAFPYNFCMPQQMPFGFPPQACFHPGLMPHMPTLQA
eukprot:845661-Pleurochrysis_carterae.AAC.1